MTSTRFDCYESWIILVQRPTNGSLDTDLAANLGKVGRASDPHTRRLDVNFNIAAA